MIRKLLFSSALLLLLSSNALAEGFSMTEWSARGLSLAGGMVGRADDASALAYNAAGITQLPGTHIMAGISTITPYGDLHGEFANGSSHDTAVKVSTWTPVHGYITHQLNDNVWLGFGLFSRFGLGNAYSGDWFGRYNVYDVGFQTVSAVPTVAYKINDVFSVSAGLEIMYVHFYEGVKIPSMFTLGQRFDNDMQLEATGVGFGAHFGLHARLNEQWSVGLAYKTQVTQNMSGDAQFARQGANLPIAVAGGMPSLRQRNADISGVIQLPDSIALGIAYKPLENLSFEVGTVFTRWSTYNHLNIYFDEPSGYRSINEKQWRDGWNFNASVEYKPLSWLALRAGYWYETPVVNETYADFMVPSFGRDVLTLGAGFAWENWTLDLAYAHIWLHSPDYSQTRVSSIQNGAGVKSGGIENGQSDLFTVSLGYSF